MKTKRIPDDDFWKENLSTLQYNVTRQGGTEAPYSGSLYLENRKGIYKCICCGETLFTSEMKFHSSCGWPSFHSEISSAEIARVPDYKYGMSRIEVKCSKCDAHLGHVFNDGPTEYGGERYCINSASMEFVEKGDNENED